MSPDQARFLRQVIDVEARRLGFQMVGVTTPDPPPHLGVFESWLEAGRHGEMGYLATERSRQRRADPRQILPECRSILILGIRYPSPDSLRTTKNPEPRAGGTGRESQAVGGEDLDFALDENSVAQDSSLSDLGERKTLGKIASYAWGEDYHDVLPRRLRALVAFIEAQVGSTIPNRWYTDTGPILERELAQRAGLGWIGKNTCLISPRQGSYFLLAEIMLGVDLKPDPAFVADRCGNCTRCLDACPTACILPNRTIDSRRCISYLMIELKGPIPHDLRHQVGDWIFGCDVCQQVCPWNRRFADSPGDPTFAPRPGVPRPDLIRELALTPEAFNRKFKGSPVKRAKRRGFLRNVVVALGNSRNTTAVPALRQALYSDIEPLVRGHAAWALGHIGGELARHALAGRLQIEIDAFVLEEIRRALDI